MSEIVRIIIRPNGYECIFADGQNWSNTTVTTPKGIDYIVYPDYHGGKDVRVEKNCNCEKSLKITYEPLSSHQALINQAKADAQAKREESEAIIAAAQQNGEE